MYSENLQKNINQCYDNDNLNTCNDEDGYAKKEFSTENNSSTSSSTPTKPAPISQSEDGTPDNLETSNKNEKKVPPYTTQDIDAMFSVVHGNKKFPLEDIKEKFGDIPTTYQPRISLWEILRRILNMFISVVSGRKNQEERSLADMTKSVNYKRGFMAGEKGHFTLSNDEIAQLSQRNAVIVKDFGNWKVKFAINDCIEAIAPDGRPIDVTKMSFPKQFPEGTSLIFNSVKLIDELIDEKNNEKELFYDTLERYIVSKQNGTFSKGQKTDLQIPHNEKIHAQNQEQKQNILTNEQKQETKHGKKAVSTQKDSVFKKEEPTNKKNVVQQNVAQNVA